MRAEDADLVARLRRHEPAAFDDVYARYHPRIFSFLLRLAGRRSIAEDLFQDTWLAAARHASDLTEETDLGAWLFTIARNRFRSHRRWAFLDFAQRERLAHEPPAHALPPDRLAEARAEASAVTEAFARITPAHREVLLLAVVEGMETAQVGAVLGLKPDAVRQRIARAGRACGPPRNRERCLPRPRPRRLPMTPHDHDPLATTLANLPDDPLDPRAAAAVLRRARGVLVDEGRPAAKLQRFWSGVLLPAVLLGCAVVYSWGALQTIERIYVAAR